VRVARKDAGVVEGTERAMMIQTELPGCRQKIASGMFHARCEVAAGHPAARIEAVPLRRARAGY
jgi:hypothetical protein